MIGAFTQGLGATQGAAASPRHWSAFRVPIVPYEVLREADSGDRETIAKTRFPSEYTVAG